jgi:hypothetical protein
MSTQLPSRRLSDRRNLKVARRPCQNTTKQGRASHKSKVGLDQKDAFHVCPRHHIDIARDLPDDAFRQSAHVNLNFSERRIVRFLVNNAGCRSQFILRRTYE